ncbi:helix-turn-helix domain-containing protein [Cohnella silvisoli]|uniref:Helix-turn-helix domain-containing protein n=1 Tax=Cohnella silvisoli TaxID=2873699 RepID=A0ABV1L032_9BACL|nr:helix-turn-helix domain-containing protein [Cohnella silvisoli]MCD9025210.1 helix-turn-helix domain-containing protein [Cohnella silvisoli]
MTDRISKEQWKIRSDFLQLRLNEPAVVAAILKCDPDKRATLSAEPFSVREQASSYMARNGVPFLCFQDIDDQLVLIMGMGETSEEAKTRIRHHLTQLGDQLEDRLGFRLFTAVGSFEASFEQAPTSYQNALLTLDYALLFPNERLLIYDSVTSTSEKKDTLLTEPEKYARLLLAHDEEAIFKQIDDDFEAFSQIGGIKPSELRNAAVEMIIQMKGLLKDFKRFQIISHAYHDIMNQVFRSTSLEQLKSHVRFIAEEVSQALSGRQEQSPVIRQIVEFVHTSYREDFSLKTLGQTYRVHPVYLGQLFQKEMNQTFSDYLNRYRVEKALELMKNTSMKTHDISEAVGYWDTAHFYKQFKKYVGVSPAQYRKLL